MEGLFSPQTRHCFMCTEDAEYYCKDCRKNFCLLCKEKHLIDLDSYFHNIVTVDVKYGNTTCEETCETHPRNVYEYWCRRCKCPLCRQCIGHRGHGTNPLIRAYERRIILNREKISKIRSEILPFNIALLAQIKNNVLHSDMARYQLKTEMKMTERAKSLQTALEFVHEQSLIFGFKNYIAASLNKLEKQTVVLESFSLYALNRQNIINMLGEIEDIKSGKLEIKVEFLFEALPDVTLKQSIE
ncbi:E3 ubiquitin-protein ligase TRIM45-like, partial [Saccostrea cucullata]|uniref:E3 ubiquitin-protein ligase TRIM45-like n=1 Tax=Saccostrea cuccullata TaxID=36930 RepID=UPI002ED49CB3